MPIQIVQKDRKMVYDAIWIVQKDRKDYVCRIEWRFKMGKRKESAAFRQRFWGSKFMKCFMGCHILGGGTNHDIYVK